MIVYMISDGRGTFIRKDCQGRYAPVRNETLADTWDERCKAQNVLNNQINKNIRSRYHIINREIEQHKEIHITKEVKDSVEKVKEISNESIEDDQIDKWKKGIDSFNGFILDMEERKENLSKELSDVDKEITDIQHYIEFGKFNAYEGWLAFSMLRHRLKKRRKIKNEYTVLSQLGECKFNSSMIADVENAIHSMSERTYTPRILTELFK